MQSEPVRVMVVEPAESREARRAAAAMGREEWLHAPWLFAAGDTSPLDQLLVVNPEVCGEEALRDARAITRALHRECARPGEFITWRFYPELDASTLRRLCTEQGWQLVAPAVSSRSVPRGREDRPARAPSA